MAYAHPYEAVNIFVLYDRIEKSADGPIQASTFLAHVMTHEITHLLQGMPFGPEDLDLIQLGLRRLAAVAVPPDLQPPKRNCASTPGTLAPTAAERRPLV